MRRFALLLAPVVLAACSPSPTAPTSTVPVPPATVTTTPAASGGATTASSQTSATQSASTTQTTLPTPSAPPTQTLGVGATAKLTYVDVTLQRFEHGQDGISVGWRVKLCYVRPYAGADGGSLRVTKEPWEVTYRDGETSSPPITARVLQLPADGTWSPQYADTRLALGACTEGWIGIRHENPDLQWLSITYSPPEFGEAVTWKN